jgi:hypothetical protein
MEWNSPRSNIIGGMVVLLLILFSGCAPTPASLDAEDTAKAEDAAGGEAGTDSQAAPQSPPDMALGLPGGINPAGMGKLGAEDIQEILDDMNPDEHTEVVLRFVSFTLLFYYYVYNAYPTAEQGLDILLNPPPAPDGKTYDPFAREILLKDGWGNRLVYEPKQVGDGLPFFKLRSLGADGIESGDDVFPDVEEVSLEVTGTIAAGGLNEARENVEE